MTPLAVTAGRVAQQLGADPRDVEIIEVAATEFPYDLPALTTASRQRVSGTARAGGQLHPFSFFVKVVQSCERSPLFAFIPPEFHALVGQQLDFRVEPMAYASDLPAALPPGLRMPACYAVIALDDASRALWLEDVVLDPGPWTHDRYRQVAHRLGRFAARRAVSEATATIQALPHRGVRDYVHGRVAHQLVPTLQSPDLWHHPLVAQHFGRLRTRLWALIEQLPALTDELESLPAGVCHGDACTRNLLWGPADEVYLVDFGFLTHAALGTDLSQLVLGEIQLAERPADDLEELDALTLEAFAAGVAEEGSPATVGQIARARAITMAIFCGLTAVPPGVPGRAGESRAAPFIRHPEPDGRIHRRPPGHRLNDPGQDASVRPFRLPMLSRSLASSRASRRETCIWLVPSSAAISAWERWS